MFLYKYKKFILQLYAKKNKNLIFNENLLEHYITKFPPNNIEVPTHKKAVIRPTSNI